MQRYGKNRYEDLDEYEDDEDEFEEEEEEQEDLKPTQEELEYLQLRQRLKESIRKQKKKENNSSLKSSNGKNKKLPYDNYGSFFGPSKPVISQRVIQESKSLLENQQLTARVSNSSSIKKISGPKTSGSKAGHHMHPPKKISNGIKMKHQKPKDTRDYSFLLSDDADLPAPTREPPSRNVHAPRPDARSSYAVQKSKLSSSNGSRYTSEGREERKPVSINRDMHRKSVPNTAVPSGKPIQAPSTMRKQVSSNSGTAGSGPGRPVVSKSLPSKMPAYSREKNSSSAPSARNSLASVNKPLPSKNVSVQKQPLQRQRELLEPSRGKTIQKQPVPSSRPQMRVNQKSSHSSSQERPKKKPARRYSDEEDDEEGGQAISSMIRKMFRYNPNKYASRDDNDDSDMEANFDDILMEEKRSALIARKEDEEELLKIEEEERREREARKRKLSRR